MTRRHWLIFAVSAMGFVFDSFDLQTVSISATRIAADLHLTPYEVGTLFSGAAGGMLVGSLLFGTAADRIGRRLCFQLSVLVFSLASGLAYFAQDGTQLVLLRFLTGIGLGGFIPVDYALMSEFMPRRRRGLLFGLWAMFLPIGTLLSARVGNLILPSFGWRPMFLAGAAPALLVLLIRFCVPESPRFLLARGRTEEARESLRWLAAGRRLPEAVERVLQIATPARAGEWISMRDVVSRPYLTRTLYLWGAWFCFVFCYFGLVSWLPALLATHKGVSSRDVFRFMTLFALSGIAGRVLVALTIDRLGRRVLVAGCASAAAAAGLAFGAAQAEAFVFAAVCALGLGLEALTGALATMTPELYPTRIRATGVGWAQGIGRLGAIAAPLVVGAVIPLGILPVFLCFAAAFLAVSLLTVTLAPETKGRSLEDAELG